MPTVEQLEELLTDDPNDTFLLYALAMELDNVQKHERSLNIFDQLMKQDPAYVPAFFMSAQQLVRLERVGEARTQLRGGIAAARAQHDAHAAAEMSEFLTSLGDMGG